MPSVLLNPAGRLWMTSGMAVWLVCGGWGLPAVVHAAPDGGGERMQVAHRNIHKCACDWWVGSG